MGVRLRAAFEAFEVFLLQSNLAMGSPNLFPSPKNLHAMVHIQGICSWIFPSPTKSIFHSERRFFFANHRAVVKSTVAFQPWCPGAGYQSLHQNSGLFLSFPCIWHMHCMCLMHLCLSSRPRYPHVYHYIILLISGTFDHTALCLVSQRPI